MAAKAKPADVEEENDKPESEGEQPAAASKFAFLKFKLPSMKWMMIGGAGLLVLVGGGGGAYFFFKGHEHKETPVAAKPATFVDLPDVLVNLSNTGADRTQYLKVKIVLELPDATLVPQIQPLMPRVHRHGQPIAGAVAARLDLCDVAGRRIRPDSIDGRIHVHRPQRVGAARHHVVQPQSRPGRQRPLEANRGLLNDRLGQRR